MNRRRTPRTPGLQLISFTAAAALWLIVFMTAVPLAVVGLAGRLPGGVLGEPGERPAYCVETPDTIQVWRETQGKTVKVDFEEYVACVTASEMPNTFHEEALKAQSVAARTFAMSKIIKYEEKKPEKHPEAPICDTTHCQVYKTEKELIGSHPSGWADAEDGWPKIRAAASATAGQLLYHGEKLVLQPLFFSSSGGQTENAEDVFVSAVPYLISVSSPYEDNATHRDEETAFRLKDFAGKVKDAYPKKDFGIIDQTRIKILSRTAGGRVEKMQVGDVALKGTEVRNALGLSSALFSISFRQQDGISYILFTSSGSGHGVGMSQYGADGMARKGRDYKEILTHYYAGVEVF